MTPAASRSDTPIRAEGFRVLCVLDDDQRVAFRAQLGKLEAHEIPLVFKDDGEEGLKAVGEIEPAVVVVGPILGLMEGLEFLALLSKRFPDFPGRVIILPEPDEPVAPMCHFRDATTGRSVTEETTTETFCDMIVELAASAGASARPVAVASPPASASHPDAHHAAIPTAAAPAAVAVAQPAATGPSKALLAVVGVVVLGALVTVGVLATGDDETPTATQAKAEDKAKATPKAKEKPTPDSARPPADGGADDGAGAPTETPKAEADEDEPTIAEDDEPVAEVPSPGSDVDTSVPAILPLKFQQAGAGYTISDPKELDRILTAFKRALTAQPGSMIEIGGHTSREGGLSLNEAVGENRARAVRQDLISRGVPEDRLLAVSYGATAAHGSGRDARQANRRVTLRLVPKEELR